jgi:glutamyl-tRNA reductase
VKTAYETAREAGLTGRVLNRLFQKSLQAAKDVRSRTAIGEGAISAGSVAVELAGRIFTDQLEGKTILIIGAGKIGETCLRHLVKKGANSVIVVNRSLDRAQTLANTFGGRAMNWEEGLRALNEVDIVLCSTGCPHKILGKKQLEGVMNKRQGRPMVLIDLSVPRNIDTNVQQLDDIYLYNIDDLEVVIRENLCHREQELSRCNVIIEQHADDFIAQLRNASAPSTCSNRLPQPQWSF